MSLTRSAPAARLVRRFPRLIDPIERGVVHLSTLVLLRDVLTESNVDEVFGREYVESGIHFRQRKSELAAAVRGLTRMGFRESEARRAVDAAVERDSEARPISDVLKDALAVLTAARASSR